MLRRLLDAPVQRKRRRGRQKTRWNSSCKRDIENVGLNLKEEEVSDITKGRMIFVTIPATTDGGKSARRRRR